MGTASIFFLLSEDQESIAQKVSNLPGNGKIVSSRVLRHYRKCTLVSVGGSGALLQ